MWQNIIEEINFLHLEWEIKQSTFYLKTQNSVCCFLSPCPLVQHASVILKLVPSEASMRLIKLSILEVQQPSIYPCGIYHLLKAPTHTTAPPGVRFTFADPHHNIYAAQTNLYR